MTNGAQEQTEDHTPKGRASSMGEGRAKQCAWDDQTCGGLAAMGNDAHLCVVRASYLMDQKRTDSGSNRGSKGGMGPSDCYYNISRGNSKNSIG